VKIHIYTVDRPVTNDIQNTFPLLSVTGVTETEYTPAHIPSYPIPGSIFVPFFPEKDKLITLTFLITGSSYDDFLNKISLFEDIFKSQTQQNTQILYFQRDTQSTVSRAIGTVTRVAVVDKKGFAAKGIVQFRKIVPGFYTGLTRNIVSAVLGTSTTTITFNYTGTHIEWPYIRLVGPVQDNTTVTFQNVGISFKTYAIPTSQTLRISFSPLDIAFDPNFENINAPQYIRENILRLPEITVRPGTNTITVSGQSTSGGVVEVGAYPVNTSVF